MTLDEQALIAAVIASPADDLPRLVYCDWLDEHGHDAHAEFIRVQIELAASPLLPASDSRHLERTATLRQMQRKLWSVTHRMREHLPGHSPVCSSEPWVSTTAGKYHFHRGFVSAVIGPLPAFWLSPYGVGMVGGPTPELVQLVRSHPVELIGVADREPLAFDGRWLWHNQGHRFVEPADDYGDHLPQPIHAEMKGHIAKPPHVIEMVKRYHTEDEARKALSDSMLTHAKRAARWAAAA